MADAIRAVAEKQGKGPNFIQWAMLLRQGSKTRESLHNEAYTAFLAQHEGDLRRLFPDLYRAKRVLEAVR